VEDIAFRVASPGLEKRMASHNGGRADASAWFRWIKERKFGPGCIQQ